ncbi:hypothetical protein FKM82_017567 [Ascaphus truei]
MTSMLPKTKVITLFSYYSTSLQPLILWTTLFSVPFSTPLISVIKLYPGFSLTSPIVLSVSHLLTPPLSISLWGTPVSDLGPLLFSLYTLSR